jgi:hypothetical protein
MREENPEQEKKGKRKPMTKRNENLRLIKVFCTPAEHGIISSGAVYQNKSLSDYIISLIREKAFEISRYAMNEYEKEFEAVSGKKENDRRKGGAKKEG